MRAPLRNRTVDLLLTMATPHRPGCTACTDGTPGCSGSTACTQCARHPVHDSFHDQHAASGPHITPGDGVQVTVSDGAVISFPKPEHWWPREFPAPIRLMSPTPPGWTAARPARCSSLGRLAADRDAGLGRQAPVHRS